MGLSNGQSERALGWPIETRQRAILFRYEPAGLGYVSAALFPRHSTVPVKGPT